MRRTRWLLYPAWIALCVALAFALRNREDPSRRPDRILSDDAALRAVSILQRSDRARYRDYQAVHVAWAGRGEGAPEARWVVLCDRAPHTGLKEAMVVELDGQDGHLLRMRRPVN